MVSEFGCSVMPRETTTVIEPSALGTALWPFTDAYYRSPIAIFPSVSRQYWLGTRFVLLNLKAVAVELLVLLPIAWTILRVTRAVTRRR